jgi:hypothetical protein
MSDVALLASALYWGVYVMGVMIAIPCALALLFGIVQTARWFLRGGQNHLPGRHTTLTRRERAAQQQELKND